MLSPKMFARLTSHVAKPAARMAMPARSKFMTVQVQFLSTGSKGRNMPKRGTTSTTPVDHVPATFTIRVCLIFLSPNYPVAPPC